MTPIPFGNGNLIVPFKGRTINPDKPVKVYRNLHATYEHDKYSIQQAGLIVAHTSQILLCSCRFIINKAGQQRVREQKRKNVHAFIVGKVAMQGAMGTTAEDLRGLGCKITYNPYKYDGFVWENDFLEPKRILWGAAAIMINRVSGVSGCGGGVVATTDAEAIAAMEHPWGPSGAGQATVLKTDRPSLRKVL